MNISYKENIWD